MLGLFFYRIARYHATSDMDGSSASRGSAMADEPVSFVHKLPSRMQINEGEAVEIEVVLTGELVSSVSKCDNMCPGDFGI